ncbi:preprotein translocase subunit YajC [Alloscardovia venturai]|uniref:Preprotein translocase subunit YajC n=1 Tax=Alloscardovia venturai TaxID=1769421 RepID=A0ABW2Y843_9BIFI
MTMTVMLVVFLIAMIALMWWQSKQQKKTQQKVSDFRNNLKRGDEVATHSGLLGIVEEVDLDRDFVIINSEGSLSKWRIQAITEPPIVPAYVSDDEVDENGNPLEQISSEDEDSKSEVVDSTTSDSSTKN